MLNSLRKHLPDAVAIIPAAVLLTTLISLWAVRMRYPFDLEWMEGGMLVHALRLQRGQALYPAPGAEFIPYIYPPGYAASLAFAAKFGGLSYSTGRALSLAGTVAAALAIVFGTAQRGSVLVGLLGAVAFLGCYPHSGAFYDLVRLDGLMMGVLAWSLVLGMVRHPRAADGSALLLAVAFLFKQHVALFGLPLMATIWLRDGRVAGLRFGALSALPALAVTVWLQVTTGGTYLDYLLKVAASHPILGHRIFPGTPNELGWGIGLVGVMATAAFLWQSLDGLDERARSLSWGSGAFLGFVAGAIPHLPGHPPVPRVLVVLGGMILGWGLAGLVLQVRALALAPNRSDRWLYVYASGVAVVALGTSALMRGHHGGYLNVQIQSFWVLALGGSLAAVELRRRLASPWVAPVTALVFAAQFGVQLGALDVERLQPTAEDEGAGYRLVAQIAELDGPVLSPLAPWLPVQAGHEPHWHLIAWWDVTHPGSPWPDYKAECLERVEKQEWGAIISGKRQLQLNERDYYRKGQTFRYRGKAFTPRTGWTARPTTVWIPDPAKAPGVKSKASKSASDAAPPETP